MGPFDDLPFEVVFNLAEAWLWFTLGCGFLLAARKVPAEDARLARWTAVALIPFGFSDLVECLTGNWWTPWWLFVWKALCVVALAACAGAYQKLLKRRAAADQGL